MLQPRNKRLKGFIWNVHFDTKSRIQGGLRDAVGLARAKRTCQQRRQGHSNQIEQTKEFLTKHLHLMLVLEDLRGGR